VADLLQNGIPVDFYNGFAPAVERLTAADLTAAASKYLDPQKSVIVVVGDRRVVEPGLRALGLPVVVVDENGNPAAG
jgi:predicted Zn-dependent peptidase